MLRSISFLAATLWLLPAFGQEKPTLSIPVLLQKAKDGRTDIARMRWQLQAVYNRIHVDAPIVRYEFKAHQYDLARKYALQLGKAELRQADLTRNGVVAGSALLLVLLAVSYNRYRIKKRSNYLLQLQKEAIDYKNLGLQQLNHSQTKLLNEKEWLLKEIHHRVKNLVISIVFPHWMEQRDPVVFQAAENEPISI